MSRLFIVEGPDCSGKTTLAKYLATAFDGTYLHMSGHLSLHASMKEYHEAILDNIEWNMGKRPSALFVLDRSWPSEFVYGREFRPHLVDRFPFAEFQKRIIKLNGKYIFCMDHLVEARHENEHVPRNHVPYDRGAFHGIVQGYQALMMTFETRTDYIHYDVLEHGSRMPDFARKVWEL